MVSKMQVPSRTPAALAILEAAKWMFYERGINAVGVDKVAEEAGVTKKTLYDQFGSKAQLVKEYLAERDRDYYDWIQNEVGKHGGRDRILAVFDALDSWMNSHSPNGCAFVHAHGDLLSVPNHPAHEVIRAEKRWLRHLFRDLCADEHLPDPDAISIQLVSLLEGATVLRSISDIAEAVVESKNAAAALLAIGSERSEPVGENPV